MVASCLNVQKDIGESVDSFVRRKNRPFIAGRFIAGAKSPFHTELTALDMALGFVQQAFA